MFMYLLLTFCNYKICATKFDGKSARAGGLGLGILGVAGWEIGGCEIDKGKISEWGDRKCWRASMG